MTKDLPWDDPDHDVVADLQEAYRKALEQPYGPTITVHPIVNRHDAEILIINGWVEGRDFDVYPE